MWSFTATILVIRDYHNSPHLCFVCTMFPRPLSARALCCKDETRTSGVTRHAWSDDGVNQRRRQSTRIMILTQGYRHYPIIAALGIVGICEQKTNSLSPKKRWSAVVCSQCRITEKRHGTRKSTHRHVRPDQS